MNEIAIRNTYLDKEEIETIYIGGGTPSLLTADQIALIFEKIGNAFRVTKDCEITLEGNPDDLQANYLNDLIKHTPINRLSIGIQSFSDHILRFLNRRHNAIQAMDSIEIARDAGFKNISVDLIYGMPDLTQDEWKRTLGIAYHKADHISAYHLSIEPGTALAKLEARGLLSMVDEEESTAQFNILHASAFENGFIHYEISNLSRPGMMSRHNSNYWLQKKYLGLGPAAHSFDGITRQWNIPNLKKYMAAMHDQTCFYEKENLSQADRFNEYLMVSFRTMKGINLSYIRRNYEKKYFDDYLQQVHQFIMNGKIVAEGENHKMTAEGWLISDYILKNLIRV